MMSFSLSILVRMIQASRVRSARMAEPVWSVRRIPRLGNRAPILRVPRDREIENPVISNDFGTMPNRVPASTATMREP